MAIAAGLLGLGLLATEALRRSAEDEAYAAHQARWDCLARESRAVAACRVLAARHPEDADYCAPAVQACRHGGTYAAAEAAEARLDRRWSAAIGMRRLAALVVLASVAWGAGRLVLRVFRAVARS